MCNHCLAHKEFLDGLEELLAKTRKKTIKQKSLDGFEYYLLLLEEIPNALPDGTGVFSSVDWVRWAKKQLGYHTQQG